VNDFLFSSLVLIVGVAICPLLVIILFVYSFLSIIKQISDRILAKKRWLSSPCPQCIYFNNAPELFCAVNPDLALTKKALDCRDFEPNLNEKIYNQSIGNTIGNRIVFRNK
jgi:hypothetical protein